MPASAFVFLSVPASVLVAVFAFRHGTCALLTLLAGIVAILDSGKRGRRALTVLRLLRSTAPGRTSPHRISEQARR